MRGPGVSGPTADVAGLLLAKFEISGKSCSMRNFPCWLLFATVLAKPTIALADESGATASANEPESWTARANHVAVAAPLVETKTGSPRLPVYVESWPRLAELTQSDPVVFDRADNWASRWSTTVGTTLELLGLSGAVAAFGTVDRLARDHWTNTGKWTVAGGLGVAIATLITAWAISPGRAEFLAVINQWNPRNPDRPLVP